MKVAILGSGDVGKSLAKGFISRGHAVVMGTGHPEKLADFSKEHKVRVASLKEAAASGDLVVVAVKGTVAPSIVRKLKKELAGKTVIDATNPLADTPPQNGVLALFTKPEQSLMELLQKAAPKAHFVKAFNSIGNAFFLDPDFGGIRPTMFYCGDDMKAKDAVKKIVEQFGFEPEDMGTAASARALEQLVILWCLPGFLRNDWAHAFKMLKK